LGCRNSTYYIENFVCLPSVRVAPITRFIRFPEGERSRAAAAASQNLGDLYSVCSEKRDQLGERVARRYLARSVADPSLRASLTPSYTMGCKRVVPTNDYLPALQRENVELLTDGIAEVRARSIVSNDGTERAVDAIVLATGFNAAEQVAPFAVLGRGGRELDQVWRDGAEAYLGTTTSGFPNLFLLIGPNTALGHSSMVFMIESQVAYVLDALKQMRTRAIKAVDLKPATQARYNARLQERMKRTVWATGCMSWYLTRSGKNTTIWPGFTFEFRLRTRRFDLGAYELTNQSNGADAAREALRGRASPMLRRGRLRPAP